MVFGVIKGSVREVRVMEQTQLEADQSGGCGALLGGGGELDLCLHFPTVLFATSHTPPC